MSPEESRVHCQGSFYKFETVVSFSVLKKKEFKIKLVLTNAVTRMHPSFSPHTRAVRLVATTCKTKFVM